MYFFYLDESGSRDPSAGTPENPKDHIYVLLAVGMYEGQWRPFEREVSRVKLDLIARLRREGDRQFELADCEVKSNWLRNPSARQKSSPFLRELSPEDIQRITDVYFDQVARRNAVVMAAVIDKRYLYPGTTGTDLHQRAYEFLLERIQNYMGGEHHMHNALIVMDDTDKDLNRAIAMRHAYFLRSGNWNMEFRNIVEYPFFTRSELSNGVQLADQLAYDVYRAFRYKDMQYPYFVKLLPYFYQSRYGATLHGLKIWPDGSPLIETVEATWHRRH